MSPVMESCLNCGAVPESGSPMGLCSRCLMERLFEAPAPGEEDEGGQGGFVTIREVAQGGMGNVVEVRDRSLKRSIAMKVMREDACNSASARQRFRREAEVLGRLEHPNIVPIHEQGVDDEGRPFYTMKLVKGRTLRAILDDLKEGKVAAYLEWDLDSLLNVFRKVGDAMSFAHSRGIVHRDLKPDNVMVGEFGEVLVMDWGLAKILDDVEGVPESETGLNEPGIDLGNLPMKDSSLTLDGSVMGTPQYMSPEQAGGRATDMDARTDVFSLGAILYQILTLRPPVRGDTVEEVLGKVRSGSFEAPTHFNPAPVRRRSKQVDETEHTTLTRTTGGRLKHCPGGRVPEALSAVTMRAMEFEKADRYSSVGDLMDDIVAYQRGFATSAEQMGALGQLWLLIKRHRLVSGLLLLMLLGTGTFVFQLMASEERSRLNAEKAEVEAGNARLAKSRAELETANAREAEAIARQEKEATRVALAQARIGLAESAYRSGDANALLRHLEECPEDLRDSNWRYLRDESDRQVGPIDALVNRNIWNCPPIPGTQSRFVTADDRGFVWDVDAVTGLATEKYRIPERGRIYLDVSRKADRLIVAQTGASKFRVIRFDTGDTILNGSASNGTVEWVHFSAAKDRILIRTASPYFLHCLHAQTGESRWTLKTPSRRIALSPVAPLVATRGLNRGSVEVRDIETGKLRMSFNCDEMTGVNRLAFSPDGRHLAAGDLNGNVLVWQIPSGRLVRRLAIGGGRIQTLQMTRSGFLIVSTGAEDISIGKKLQVFSLASGRLAETQLGIRSGAIEGILHPDSGYLMFSGVQPSIWRVGDGRELVALAGARVPLSVGFMGEDQVFGSWSQGTLALFESAFTDSPEIVWHPRDPSASLLSIVPDGSQAIAADRRGREFSFTRLRLTADGKVSEYDKFQLPRLALSVDLNAKGDNMLSVLRDGRVVETTIESATHRTILKARAKAELKAVRYVAESRLLVVCKGTRGLGKECDNLELWNLTTGERVETVALEFVVNDLAVDPGGGQIAVVGDDWGVHLFESRSLKPVHSFRGHDQQIKAVSFHPLLPILATGSADLAIKLWNARDGVLLDRFLGSPHEPLDLAFSPSGAQLVVGSGDKKTRIYRTDHLAKLLR